MNTLKLKFLVYPLIALGSIAASGLALADDPTPDNLVTSLTVSTKTRAEVVAEWRQSRATRGFRYWSTSYNPLAELKPTRTRDEVRADVLLATVVTPTAGEDSGSFAMSRAMTRRDALQGTSQLAAAPSNRARR